MKRYYISPVIGNGTAQNPYRAKVVDYGGNTQTVMMMDAGNRPILPWALTIVGDLDHSARLADLTIQALPDMTKDSTLSVLKASDRNALLSLAQAKGVDVSSIKTNSSFRELVRAIGKHLAPLFDENRFDVKD